jgi:hypothetical protein
LPVWALIELEGDSDPECREPEHRRELAGGVTPEQRESCPAARLFACLYVPARERSRSLPRREVRRDVYNGKRPVQGQTPIAENFVTAGELETESGIRSLSGGVLVCADSLLKPTRTKKLVCGGD